jgi:hypothetical protein
MCEKCKRESNEYLKVGRGKKKNLLCAAVDTASCEHVLCVADVEQCLNITKLYQKDTKLASKKNFKTTGPMFIEFLRSVKAGTKM